MTSHFDLVLGLSFFLLALFATGPAILWGSEIPKEIKARNWAEAWEAIAMCGCMVLASCLAAFAGILMTGGKQ